MATSAIEGVLWPGLKALEPEQSLLGGITVNKGGYHSTRNWLRINRPNDYSIQLLADMSGPGDEGSALDWTFKDAQGSMFQTINKYSKRLLAAGQAKDPRAYPLREFQGNADSDRDVEGWSYYRDHALTTSDLSHLWHIHFSIWRKYINDETAMRSILSILSGEEDDNMPLSTEDLAKIRAIVREEIPKVWAADVIKPPEGHATADNPKWTAGGTLSFVAQAVDTIRDAEPIE